MSRVVYVGHVPFDMTEEQIEDIFRSAGPVEQTRLVFDRVTGKSKGFAFVQYFEPESAASAVRNLDNYKIGSMHLKVNYSSGRFPGNNSGNNNNNGGNNNNNNNNKQRGDQQDDTGIVPEIVNVVSGIPPQQKIELLSEMKSLIASRRDDTLQMMNQNPQLSYAIVQGMFELGMIDGNAAASLIVPPNASKEPPVDVNNGPRNGSNRGGPRANSRGPTKEPIKDPSREPSKEPDLPPEQRRMYQQIMALSPDQLNMMSPEQRQAALEIRAQVESRSIIL